MRHAATRLLCLVSVCWTITAGAGPGATPDAVTADGGRYYGPMVHGRLHGQGRMEWDNGSSYVGGFADGQFSGTGRLQTGPGVVYEGEFEQGLMAGHGVYRLADRCTFAALVGGTGKALSRTGRR